MANGCYMDQSAQWPLQEWHYKHAVRINAEDAAKHGLHEGALVLESTLAATPSSSQEAPSANLQSQEGEAVVSFVFPLLCCVMRY